MNKFRFAIRVLAIATFMFALASLAQAQATRTWVSGVGDDANPCSRTAPCKTFAGSISKTAVNGVINCLDPGGFGAVTITKSITIDCHEIYAGILNAGTTGVNVATDSFTDSFNAVRLRNLNFDGAGTAFRGVRITGARAGTKVYIEDCMMDGQNGAPGVGIEDVRTGSGNFLGVFNTTIRNTAGAGIVIRPASGGTSQVAVISNSRVYSAAGAALSVGSGGQVSVTGSIFSGSNTGVFTDNVAGSTNVSLDNCQITGNGTGVNASTANTSILVSNSILVANGTLATSAGGGVVASYGNNMTGGAAFGTPVLQK